VVQIPFASAAEADPSLPSRLQATPAKAVIQERRTDHWRYGAWSDVQPHIGGGLVAGKVNVPAPVRGESKPRSPFVAGTVIAACQMRLRPEDQGLLAAVRCREGNVQWSRTRHPPHDLQLVASAGRNMAERKTPNLSVRARCVNLVRPKIGTEVRRRGARCAW
jgi:hypothetical protein